MLETGFAVNALVAIVLNLILPEEDEAEEIESLAGYPADSKLEMKIEPSDAGASKVTDVGNVHNVHCESTEHEIELKV